MKSFLKIMCANIKNYSVNKIFFAYDVYWTRLPSTICLLRQNEGWRGLLTQQTASGNAVVEYKPLNRSCTSLHVAKSRLSTVNIYVSEIGLINLTKAKPFLYHVFPGMYIFKNPFYREINKYKKIVYFLLISIWWISEAFISFFTQKIHTKTLNIKLDLM